MQQSRWNYTHNDPSHSQLQDSPYTDSPGDPRAPQEHRGGWLHPVPPVECLWPLSVSPSDNQAVVCQLLHQSHLLSSWKSVLFPRYFYWQHRRQTLCKLHHRHWWINPIYPQGQAFSNTKGIKEKISVQASKTQTPLSLSRMLTQTGASFSPAHAVGRASLIRCAWPWARTHPRGKPVLMDFWSKRHCRTSPPALLTHTLP